MRASASSSPHTAHRNESLMIGLKKIGPAAISSEHYLREVYHFYRNITMHIQHNLRIIFIYPVRNDYPKWAMRTLNA